MARNLPVGSRISLLSGNEVTEFVVEDILGIGGSCIAYTVSFMEGDDIVHRGVLKEFCPAFLDNGGGFERKDSSVVVESRYTELFSNELDRFRDTYRTINDYLSQNPSAANYHPVQLGLFAGNNTLYTLTSGDYGKSYDKITDTSLCSILRIMLSVTKAVELYHNAGFLHLDIKPKNILVLDDVRDIVKLFDYDSLTPMETIRTGELSAIPLPEDYYVPELYNYEIRSIGIQTDIFEIGAMLFCRVFGRAPSHSEMEYHSVYSFDEAELVTGISPQAKHELETVFRKTIQISGRSRYKSTTELKNQLTKLISLISENPPYIINLPRWQQTGYAVGRENEVSEIKRRLAADGYVFVRAIGGLGKSELTKIFVAKHGSEYHTVQFCKYNGSLSSLVAAMPVSGINDSDYSDIDELVKDKLKILHSSDEHTLIIVDNFNTTHDKKLRDFLPADNKSYKVIFTTRCIPAADYYSDKVYELPKLSEDECIKLFCMRSGIKENGVVRERLSRLISMVQSNTLLLVLLSGAVKKTGMTPDEIIIALEKQKLVEISADVFHEYDYYDEDIEDYGRIYTHLTTIFSVSGLSDAEKTILKNMSLVSQDGVGRAEFVEWCNDEAITAELIESLSSQGWIEIGASGRIMLHPIVSDLISDNDTQRDDSYYSLFEALEDFCDEVQSNQFMHTLERFACALQLDRRSVNEEIDTRVSSKGRLGRMYKETYRPKKARESLNEALEMCQGDDCESEYKPYIYYLYGDVEAVFGTPGNAIAYYERAIDGAQELEDAELLVEGLTAIGSIHEDNSDYEAAYSSYITAYRQSEDNTMLDYAYILAEKLSDVCKELNNAEQSRFFSDKAQKLKLAVDECTDEKESEDEGIDSALISAMHIGMSESLFVIESYHAKIRGEFGEDSPIYKETLGYSWVFYALDGDKIKAMQILSENLAFIASSYGEQSIAMAERLTDIAMYMPDLFFDELTYAERCAKRAIQICEAIGEGHVFVYTRAKLALAKLKLTLGKQDEAKRIVDTIDFEEFSGKEFRYDLVDSAGLLLYEISEFSQLEKLCKDMLLRVDDSDVMCFMPNILLAWMCLNKGDLGEALEYTKRAESVLQHFAANTTLYGMKLVYYRTLGKLSYCQGDIEGAIEKTSHIIDEYEKSSSLCPTIYSVYIERGLYYAQSKRFDEAKADYMCCERILVDNNYPQEAFIPLYNNVSVNYLNQGDFSNALEYLKRITKVKPKVMAPTSQFDAVVCANIGWALANLGNLLKGELLIKIAIVVMDKNGAGVSIERFAARRNLCMIYDKQKKYKKSIKLNLELYKECDDLVRFPNALQKTIIATDLLISYLDADMWAEGYGFANSAENRFAQLYGRDSEERIELLLRFGDIFKAHGSVKCRGFFDLADRAIGNAGLRSSVLQARLLNYLGVCSADIEEDYYYARFCLNESKDLFERLGETDNTLYTTVINNISYTESKIADMLDDRIGDDLLLIDDLLSDYEDDDN